jgi:ESCRT-I complex subunit VPS28
LNLFEFLSNKKEVKLYKNPKDREKYDNQANLFAILSTIQQLEKAYIRDCITSGEYTSSCTNLLTQYKTAFKLVEGEEFKNIDDFVKRYKMDCAVALARVKEGRPITVKNDKENSSKAIAQIVSV